MTKKAVIVEPPWRADLFILENWGQLKIQTIKIRSSFIGSSPIHNIEDADIFGWHLTHIDSLPISARPTPFWPQLLMVTTKGTPLT